jgi:hypothetical protein
LLIYGKGEIARASGAGSGRIARQGFMKQCGVNMKKFISSLQGKRRGIVHDGQHPAVIQYFNQILIILLSQIN